MKAQSSNLIHRISHLELLLASIVLMEKNEVNSLALCRSLSRKQRTGNLILLRGCVF